MKLFTSYKLGQIDLKNRVVMAPMTRSRAEAGDDSLGITVAPFGGGASAGASISSCRRARACVAGRTHSDAEGANQTSRGEEATDASTRTSL